MKKILLIVLALICVGHTFAQEQYKRSETKVIISNTAYYVHVVKSGESLASICDLYGIDRQKIIDNNPHIGSSLKVGEAVKIPVQAVKPVGKSPSSRKQTIHTVNPGETTYAIAKRYGVTVENLLDANPQLDPLHISVGQNIAIPRTMIGKASDSEVKEGFDNYNKALSSVTPDYVMHLVEAKETLYSISKKYGIEIGDIERSNVAELKDGLKYGSVIKIPTATAPKKGEFGQVVVIKDKTAVAPKDIIDRDSFTQYHPLQQYTPKRINKSDPIEVALLLPFKSENSDDRNFVEFYNGALLAMKDLKRDGVSATVKVFNAGRSETEVSKLIDNGALKDCDLIIGPVYNEAFTPAADYAQSLGIPIVSPLAAVTSDNPNVYQVAPNGDKMYDKLKEYTSGNYNIIVIKPTNEPNEEFYNEISHILPRDVKTINNYSKSSTSANVLDNALIYEKENLLIIASDNQSVADEILTRVSSIQNRTGSNSGRSYRITTIGTSRWARFQNFDRELFFRLGVMYITTYYADRSNNNILKFDSNYITAFNNLPSYYSYRGYDVTKLFVTSLFNHLDGSSEVRGDGDSGLLEVKYDFERTSGGKWVNNEWVLVKYNPDYTIEVK